MSVNEINYGWETLELIRYRSKAATPTINRIIEHDHLHYMKFSLGKMRLSNIVLLKPELYMTVTYIPA